MVRQILDAGLEPIDDNAFSAPNAAFSNKHQDESGGNGDIMGFKGATPLVIPSVLSPSGAARDAKPEVYSGVRLLTGAPALGYNDETKASAASKIQL